MNPLSLNTAPSLGEQARRLESFEIALRDQKIEALEAEILRLTVKENSTDRVLGKALQNQRHAEAEVKRLKALDPDRLRKNLDRLKKEKVDLQVAAQELRERNHQLTKRNRQLDRALDKAIAEANSDEPLKPVVTFEPARCGKWELFTFEQNGCYQLLDVDNQVSQTVCVEAGEIQLPKVRPVPKAVAAAVVDFHGQYFGKEVVNG